MTIKKVLIANRGEIAVRIARACQEMDIKAVAIYSQADQYSLHVKKADEAYQISTDPLSGYLNPHHVVNLAVETGCDALHPGYGFLSENATLAQVCKDRGIRFIGPSADVMKAMGDKTEARQTAEKAKVPVTPGTGNLKDIDEALQEAGRIGYPVMLKATSGGGGRGIRRCNDEKELKANFDRVISEATKAFGSAEVFLEKFVVNPRHIEVQILADSHGNVIHLYERDCSIQRRNQKLIELAPSPQLTEEQRQYIGDLAVRVATGCGYENAGTVEFLLDDNDEFYFMEMNTRVQVEHTITEQITGVDIVKEQIRIAAGEKLRYRQDQISYRGFAAQFRINAEDPQNNFLPSFGRISRYYSAGGPGVRTDAAIYSGYDIPPFYDSMCAKLIVWAMDWEELLARSGRALHDMNIYGVRTTIPYYENILNHPDFRAASFNTGFVEAHPELTQYSLKSRRESIAAAVAAAIAAQAGL
ncbi:acetyl-CoA carboxylase biotin carboxylase subunit [Hydrocarboniclastica marina]|uniref:Biotin carboxylase n=1 Tax=Hydrocarboniclastica marina TaxID=2259620 RepID=A0A4P7XID7_9ALTE|nr:acetyl-CoA carboxylase biotin carboxylase subunit [Hydrocarboniclastica marina]MAL99310.1 pyruvate carboxylase subunit A [Alteromonadaceae bacterium]QCF26052.1 acetyl-CoA carboxylase biotin carboxylase subunit [Hydrocarboniclastica marina]